MPSPLPALRLTVLPDLLAVCRLSPDAPMPDWAASFFSITRTLDELSIVCPDSDVPDEIKAERGWRALKVNGPLDFALVGILASLTRSLSDAGISIFAISTYDTDYILVKATDMRRAIDALNGSGHIVEPIDKQHSQSVS